MTQEQNYQKLPDTFIGRGEVKGFRFEKHSESPTAYIYAVWSREQKEPTHYEVFKKKINTQYNMESYPRSNSFGVWSWCYIELKSALEKYKKI